MTRRSRRPSRGANDGGEGLPHGSSTPTQQDESDILDELDVEHDEETGNLVADEETVKKVGALDAETVRENRRQDQVVGKKRANQKNVTFNESDPLALYETLLRIWPANSIDIFIRRLTGAPVQTVITTRPRSASELYEALRAFHGQHEEAEYSIDFLDTGTKQYRARSKRLVMPDTRPPTAQQGQPMQPPYGYPPGYPPPPGYAPVYPPQPGYPPLGYPPGAPQTSPAPAPGAPPLAPVVQVHAPPAPGFGEMVEMLRQVQALAQSMMPPQPAAPVAPVYAPTPAMPPPPPANADPATLFAYTRQLVELVQQLTAARGATPSAPVVAPAPVSATPPQPHVPPGHIWIAQLGTSVPLDRLAQAIANTSQSGGNNGAPSGPPRAPGVGYGPPRMPYRGPDGGYPAYPSQQSPPRERSITDQFRDSITMVRTVKKMAEEVGQMFPGQEDASTPTPSPETHEEGGPIKVMDIGGTKLAFDGESGGLRPWETGMMNIDRIAKTVKEQIIDPLQARRGEAQRKAPLPAGFVEMHPGYEPPSGFVAIPVDQLPPPPADVPPPVSAPASGPPHASWGAPVIPAEGHSIG